MKSKTYSFDFADHPPIRQLCKALSDAGHRCICLTSRFSDVWANSPHFNNNWREAGCSEVVFTDARKKVDFIEANGIEIHFDD